MWVWLKFAQTSRKYLRRRSYIAKTPTRKYAVWGTRGEICDYSAVLRAVKNCGEKNGYYAWLVDGVEHAVPAGAGGEVGQGIEDASEALPEGAVVGVIIAGGVDGPIN